MFHVPALEFSNGFVQLDPHYGEENNIDKEKEHCAEAAPLEPKDLFNTLVNDFGRI